RISVLDSAGQGGNDFARTDVLTIAANIAVDPADVGNSARLFCVVIYNGAMFARNEAGVFTLWDGNEATLPAMDTRVLTAVEVVSIVQGLSNVPGQFQLYVAYENENQQLVYSGSPATFSVAP
ncbi:MAG: hypothetical protein O2948_15370, partial [Proteobacteria bacterium]|nr:hypothetical protein [Pseudomonadota bacterium]